MFDVDDVYVVSVVEVVAAESVFGTVDAFEKL